MDKNKRPDKGRSLTDFLDDYTVVDVETNTVVDGVIDLIEVAALRVRGGRPVATFSSFVRPHASIDWFIRQLTGITDNMVWNAPLPADVLPDFCAFVGDDTIVGHNVNYDVNVLYDNMLRYLDKPLVNDFVDVLRLSRRLLPDLESHKQTYLAQYFGYDTRGAHRALADCELCHLNYRRLKDVAEGR